MSVVGFDIGYQTCFIAVARQGGIETVANEYSDRNTPAYVSFSEKNREFGATAKNGINSNIKNTLWGWKKLMARPYKDAVVQTNKALFPYEILEGPDGKVLIKVSYQGETQNFSPEQVTSMLMVKLRDTASIALNIKVVDCVINCPCYYTDAERWAVLDAAKVAGLNVLRLMNDTTATALAYGIYKQDLPAPEEKSRNVVFVDLGHSDLQCSAVAFNKGKLRVLATSADPNLGGRDFDLLLAEHFTEDFKQRYKVDAHTKPRAFVKLLTECEKLKKLMSANTQPIPLNIECFMEDKDVSGRLSRDEMEQLAAPLFQRAENVMRAILDNAKLQQDEVYSVEIVGGSSRIPAIKQLVSKVFGKEPSTTLNSDEAVARGCALQCAILSPVFRVRDFSITDVQPYAITLSWTAGLEDDSEMEVFTKNHAVPFSKMLTFHRKEPFCLDARYTTVQDLPYNCGEIGQFRIDKVIPTPTGEGQKVKVKVRVNINGTFVVSTAVMVEKIEQQEEPKETPMETEDNEKKPDSEGEAPPANEKMETNDAGAENQENAENEKKPEDENNKDAAAEEKKEVKKKSKVKSIDLPITSKVANLSQDQLNNYLEKEGQMQAADRLEKERADAKNAVEEYVYDMRARLSDALEPFIREADREAFSAQLTAAEDWLYDEGEDQLKQVYVDKLGELKKVGDPVVNRYLESTTRPAAFEELGHALVHVRKVLEQYSQGDEKYNHIEKADMEKVEKSLKEKSDWFEKNFQQCQALKPFDDPPVLTHLIRSSKMGLEAVCNPIINKPKPKPKEEPPKEAKKDEASANKDAPAENAENAENTTQNNAESTENADEKGDMELD